MIKKRVHIINGVSVKNIYENYRFLCGSLFAAGTFCMNIFCDYFYDKLGIYSSYFMETYKNIDVDSKSLLVYAIKNMFAEVMIVMVISFTSVGGIFLNLYCAYKGAVIALLISSSVLKYGFGGVVIYLLSIMPHYITYGVLLAIIITTGFYVWEKMKLFRKSRCMGESFLYSIKLFIRELVGEKKIPLFLLCVILLIVITAFLEVYVNSAIIKKFI
ncbi:MAG: stage II sporulation protein M [Lachnospiraceae bacterium]